MVRPAPIKAGMAQAGLADTGGADARGLIAAAHATPSCGASHATPALDARHHLLRAPPQVPASDHIRFGAKSMKGPSTFGRRRLWISLRSDEAFCLSRNASLVVVWNPPRNRHPLAYAGERVLIKEITTPVMIIWAARKGLGHPNLGLIFEHC